MQLACRTVIGNERLTDDFSRFVQVTLESLLRQIAVALFNRLDDAEMLG